MAFEAILIIGNVRFDMNGCHVLLCVLMATETSVARVIRRMTNSAIRVFALVPMIERKRVLDKSRRTPSNGGMAGSAIGSKLSAMDLRIGVTRNAIGRRAAIAIIDVTLRAGDVGMFAIERKHGRMIEIF